MIVKMYTLKNGLEIFNDVVAIRIKNKDYNLLILKDYISLLGEIHGYFEIEFENEVKKYENLNACFMNNNNVFSIIIDREYNG